MVTHHYYVFVCFKLLPFSNGVSESELNEDLRQAGRTRGFPCGSRIGRKGQDLAVSENSPGQSPAQATAQGATWARGGWYFPRANRKFAKRKLLSHRAQWLREDRFDLQKEADGSSMV